MLEQGRSLFELGNERATRSVRRGWGVAGQMKLEQESKGRGLGVTLKGPSAKVSHPIT